MARTRKGRWDYKPEAWKHPSKSTGCMVFVILFMGLFASTMFVSCSKEEELEKEETKTEKPNNNPLVGSVWGHSSDDNDVQWLEFIDNKNFMKYFGDKEGTPRSDVWYGTYKYSDGKVVFSETHGHNPYDYATINGSIMTLFYKTGWKITFKRKS